MSVITPITPNASQFCEYIERRYKGRMINLERMRELGSNDLIVRLEFRIPDDGVDELEMFRRINRVIEVVVEGDDAES